MARRPKAERRVKDLATGVGLLGGFGVAFTLIVIDGGDFGAYYDKHALIVIFGGATMATMMPFAFSTILHGLPMGLRFAFTMRAAKPRERIEEITRIAGRFENRWPHQRRGAFALANGRVPKESKSPSVGCYFATSNAQYTLYFEPGA